MKKFVVMAMAVFLVVAVSGMAGAANTPKATQSTDAWGTVCYKFTIDSDSNEVLGALHTSLLAVKTPWVDVPYGVPFSILVETRDIDSVQ